MRPSARDLLKHPVFDNVRVPDNEVQADHKISMDIDKTSPISYEENESDQIDQGKSDKILTKIKIDLLKEVFKVANRR